MERKEASVSSIILNTSDFGEQSLLAMMLSGFVCFSVHLSSARIASEPPGKVVVFANELISARDKIRIYSAIQTRSDLECYCTICADHRQSERVT